MIASTHHQSWLFYLPLSRQASLLKDDLLDEVDLLLDDPQLVELVRRRLATRCPQSTRTGRLGIAPDRLLRCCVLKHLKGWSFRELERELRSNLIYRRFTRYDAEATPHFSTLSRLFALLGSGFTAKIHERVVAVACEQGVAQGRKLRTDTTVVETNIHYPTDSSLLGDGIRVLSRSLTRIATHCKHGTLAGVDHTRSVKHRLLEISRAAKSLTRANRRRMVQSYEKLLTLSGSLVRQAARVVERWQKHKLPVVGNWPSVDAQISQLQHFLPLVKRVMHQTKERVRKGNSQVIGKVLSLFEPHSEVIRKGKAHKPNEFGRLVRLDEVENGIVSGYQVLHGNHADTNSFLPALENHQACFGRVPHLACADRGFFSPANERQAQQLGVKRVVLPARGRLSRKRDALQKQRWFRRALRWRAGLEATSSTLKHPFSMARALYTGEFGFERYVGWSVITKNLFSIARWQRRRQDRRKNAQIDGDLGSAASAQEPDAASG